MANVFVVDLTKCIGCYNCQISCKDEHVDNDWSPIAKSQPNTGQFWHRIEEVIRGQVPRVRMAYLHHICQHCDDAPCMKACNSDAIYKREDGTVIIAPEKCTGGKACMEACPYGVIYFNDELNIAQKCTWCAHLRDEGWTVPRCVDACPTGALQFGEEKDLADVTDKAEQLLPEKNTKPRTYYIGIPKKFIAGGVYDPDIDECLDDAKVTLLDNSGNVVSSAVTDLFGDFTFEGLEVGIYSISIEKDGYPLKEIAGIDNHIDRNVGEIAMQR